MLVQLDRGSKIPYHLQIRNQLRERILSGALPPGSRLPATRDLARALGVNRTTVVTAYRALWSEGLVKGRAGGGTVVARPPEAPGRPSPAPLPLVWEDRYTARVRPSAHWTEGAAPKGRTDVIPFDAGSPPAELFPVDAVREAVADVLARGPNALRYTPAPGDPELRRLLAERLELAGIRATPSQVLVLSGSEQGIFLVAQALLEPGDGVVVEAPTYPGALRTFRILGAQLHPVPVDEDGMRLDVLEGVLAHGRPKLIYTVPTFHNPTGTTMSADRRRALLDLAYRYRVPILEDDPYHALRYEGAPVPPIKALDRQNHVIYLSTFSKAFFPGLRVGWLVAPSGVTERLAALRRSLDLCPSSLGQAVAHELLRRNTGHVERVVPIYRARRDAMLAALDRHCRRLMDWHRPQGGFFVWVKLRDGVYAEELLAEAVRTGVTFVPGRPFFPEGAGGEAQVRLSFPGVSEERIEEGVRRLAAAFRRCRTRQGKEVPPEAVAAQARPLV